MRELSQGLAGARVSRFARRLRRTILEMVHRAQASHVGSSLSVADILAVLYLRVLRFDPARPDHPSRDRLIMSKGHAAAALYATLALCGFFPEEWLASYCADGSPLAGHVHHHGVPGVELSTGSLGHGLSVGCGMALADRLAGLDRRVFVVMGDGECNEGSVWEAAAFAGHHRLEALTAVVDANGLQGCGPTAEVLDAGPLVERFRAFGWESEAADGHSPPALEEVLLRPREGRPRAVVARTVKGKGVSFMEGDNLWHYRNPGDEQLALALAELADEPEGSAP